ncbi:MAG TPA: hypothetical protein VFE50_23710, partial [Cyclobacteriaceae bacterium]|nr:hypothetical protein [Cyclobacteriaceae bacterium]
MNYHLVIDHRFVNGFISVAEAVSAGKNTYIFFFEKPAKNITHTNINAVYAQPGTKEFEEVMSSIKTSDRFFIHWFHDAVHHALRRLPP